MNRRENSFKSGTGQKNFQWLECSFLACNLWLANLHIRDYRNLGNTCLVRLAFGQSKALPNERTKQPFIRFPNPYSILLSHQMRVDNCFFKSCGCRGRTFAAVLIPFPLVCHQLSHSLMLLKLHYWPWWSTLKEQLLKASYFSFSIWHTCSKSNV